MERFVNLDKLILESNDEAESEKLLEDFKKASDHYQEQPELLEPHLPELIARLTNVSSKNSAIQFKFLYQLIKVIGFKTAQRHFPHETSKLPMIVDLLEDPQRQDWETRYVLIVWLSIVVLNPFDLAKFGSNVTDRIYSILVRNLANHDSCQHVASYCLAKFFSRKDIAADEKMIEEFFAGSLDHLDKLIESTKIGSGFMSDIKLIGNLRALAYVFKFLPRHQLQRRSRVFLEKVAELDVEKINSELVNHLLVKFVQRLGLCLLPRRLASWRHRRGMRIIGTNRPASQVQQGNNKGELPPSEHGKAIIGLITGEPSEADDLGAMGGQEPLLMHNSTDWLESILNLLFVAARSGQTKVRWSAGKGIARLASRLDRQRASDVIDMVLGNFFDLQDSSAYAWHGGCLTLAEMSRQGLILEEKLDLCMGVIGEAIVYDKIKGSLPVGAHIREAACYIIWAMARTYEDHHLAAHISKLSTKLMCTIVFDRELQCRRAASATFQELIGRQGAFHEEALTLLASVDYQNVGQRQFAYLDLSARVARIGGSKYYEPFIEHLLDKKLPHWDLQIRRLACDSLALLMLHPTADYIETKVLSKLRNACKLQQPDNNLKHGAVLGLAKVIKSLVALDYKFNEATWDLVGGIGDICNKQLKSKQQAANFLEAICHLISAAEAARFEYCAESGTLKQWEQLIFQSLDSDNAELRDVASSAYLSLYRYYYKQNKTHQDRLLTLANRTLASANESSRCGALKCLSKLGLALSDAQSDSLLSSSISMDGGKVGASAFTATTTTTTSASLTFDQSNANQFQSLPGQADQERRPCNEPEIEHDEATKGQKQHQQQNAHLQAFDPPANKSTHAAADSEHSQQQAQLAHKQLLGTGGEIKLDSDTPDIILMSLTSYLARDTREKSSDQVFSLAKAECCNAFVNFVRLLDKSRLIISTHWLRAGFEALLAKTEDYTFDKRGDIGVQVRKAAVRSLQELCSYLIATDSSYPLLYEPGRLQSAVTKMLQQCVSYNNSAREMAAISFYRLIGSIDQEPPTSRSRGDGTQLSRLVAHFDDILGLLQKYQADKLDEINWRDDSTPLFVELLAKQEYALDLWAGLIPALGQASEVYAKQFRDSLAKYIRENLLCDEFETSPAVSDSGKQQRRQLHDQVFESFLQAFELALLASSSAEPAEAKSQATKQRLLTATDYLLTQGLMNDTSSAFQERLAELCWQCSSGSSGRASASPRTLMLASRVLCSMLRFRSRKCLEHCLALLSNGLASVRAYTAEQLYLSIMDEDLVPNERECQNEAVGRHKQMAMDLLSETQWTEPLEKVLPIRQKIRDCLLDD